MYARCVGFGKYYYDFSKSPCHKTGISANICKAVPIKAIQFNGTIPFYNDKRADKSKAIWTKQLKTSILNRMQICI